MNTTDGTRISRRALLKGSGMAAAAAATALLPEGAAKAEMAPPRKEAPRWGMVMDLRKCIGCRACTVACKAEYETPLGRFRCVIQEVELGSFPDTKKVFLPLMCNHCEGDDKDKVPPCVSACPEWPSGRAKYSTPDGKTIRYKRGATYKRPDGMILVDNSLCIGCGKCIDACPYGVRSFNPMLSSGKKPEKNGIEKCTLCQHRVDKGVEPACVTTCQGHARIFGDLNDPDSAISKLAAEWKLLENKDKTTLLPEEHTYAHVFYIDPDNLLAEAYIKRKPKELDHYMDQIP